MKGRLTPREREVLYRLLVLGETNKKVAESLGVSYPTVSMILRRITQRTNAKSPRQAIARAVIFDNDLRTQVLEAAQSQLEVQRSPTSTRDTVPSTHR